jgi:hypothetical protein
MIKCSLFSIVLPPISLARPGQKRTKKEAKLDAVFPLSSSRFSLRQFEAREKSGVLGATFAEGCYFGRGKGNQFWESPPRRVNFVC